MSSRRDSTESGDLEHGKSKRKRAAYSCTECTKAKSRCDRQQPCSRCTGRRVPGLCHYLTNGYEDPLDISRDVRERLIRIERLLLENRSNNGQSANHEAGEDAPTSSGVDAGRSRGGFVTRGRYYGPSAMSHVGDGAGLDIMRALDVPDPESPETNALGGDRRPARDLVDILHELPPRGLCDELVRLYFDNINLTRYPLNRSTFMDIYDALWTSMSAFSLDPTLIHRLSLVLIILAISTLSAPNALLGISPDTAPDAAEKKLAKANELFKVSRRAAAHSDGLMSGRGEILMVLSDVLTVRYLILARRAPDGLPYLGAAVSRAQAIGLHRSARAIGDISANEAQERNLIWSYVYHMDRYCSLLLGQPLSFGDDSCDADTPLSLNAHGVESAPGEVTYYTFILHRMSLARIMSRIAKDAFALEEPPYKVIRAIDEDLRQWAESLPAEFRIRSYGDISQHNLSDPILAVHRHLISTEYHFARTCLHRPYLARPDTETEYKLSRDACLDAAMADLWDRTTFSAPGVDNLSTGSYRVANSLIILGITLLLNPAPDIVSSIQDCLSRFTASRTGHNNILDHIRIKEIAMVEMLQGKAKAVKAQSRLPSPQPAPVQVSDAVDPALQTFFDQFWGPMAMPGLYGGNIGALNGAGGDDLWDNLNLLLGSGAMDGES